MAAQKKYKLTFEEVKRIVQSEHIGSEQQFYEWWKSNKPKVVPARPYRVYTKEWKGWNDFLGLRNKFGHTRTGERYRPYDEAVLWVHKLNIKNKHQWDIWCDENKDKRPNDIPLRPDLVYKKNWISWNHWLGNTSYEKVEAQKQARKEAAIFYVIHEAGYTHNILTFGIDYEGKTSFKEKWEKLRNFTPIKLYRYRHEAGPLIQNILDQRSSPVFGNPLIRIVPNIPQLLWDLSTILDYA